ncbi:hypothetical protein [Pseudomonas aeruginosa]|uniref:hypothetical protein n=2 Tax=Pseudomonas aeruginosa TaxID=287 RepID=UPI000452D003|nr:hypothetical protein [Pseudomonas aeruginosa]EVT82793.1 hypothetical protein Z046_31735 [Pseudomonas aeruginosa VRFPA09]AVN42383.1 hypothetical protein AM474_02425 [Pseudomonas aeruginosa]EIU1412001.1 hypothetical protein [Pseudomonas aeruginosa]EIU3709939.1 hypothetical protein [Pseudomonas aeruginosa]EIU3904122.1 hypothetical protein [Pseudomonas aeruginosa]
MPMFDLEDVGRANLKRCKTKDSELVRGKRIGVLDAKDCEAEKLRVADAAIFEPGRPLWKKVITWFVDYAMQIAIAVIATGIAAYMGYS